MSNSLTFFSDYLSASIRLAVPLAFAALGGLWSERSGVLNIGLEGMLLTGGFVGAVVTATSGSAWFGIMAAAIAGAGVGCLHAVLCVTLRVDQIVSGLAINLSAAGLTAFASRLVFNVNTPQQLAPISGMALPGLSRIPGLGPLLFQQDGLFYVLLLLILLSTYLLFHTSFGLMVRAVGDYPRAADTAGVSVAGVRYASVITSGILAALGGAYLVLVHVRFFTEGISAGKGFIAIAALIFGRWHPVGTALACLLFGATEALQLRVQAFNLQIPYQFLVMLPYGVALLALVGLAGQSNPPAALGVPYVKENAGD